ncbi:NAD(P)-dependent oxidoreductase [Oscillochloris sp. ZM17-4]|uniref:NAD-dependent epimerase/dehydratase family protein n=1 Tax=Oscillochloris sp. ZM17-4 TaxID=2866714 RepID=UPI001C733F79|nr:NAD(P)-dependent oxidoreductase [Oscillochloris sp. ZM17-4]MBX0331380.1 NAD(P)-dependent oxidoreductase [Oscillochloris sp. ZM17-4]
MHIALTGGSGRVGRGIIDLALEQGHTIVSIDRVAPAEPRAGVRFVHADVTDYDSFLAALGGCEGLIHMAAIPSPGHHPDHVVHNNNVAASYNALRAAAELGVRKVCQASSINAVGAAYSRWPIYDYLPLDEAHPTYNEDPYSLSKWICEAQGDSIARRYAGMTIASMRFHWVTDHRPNLADHPNINQEALAKNLWAYTLLDAAARACLAVMTAAYIGHEVFFIAAPTTVMDETSLALAQRYFPDAELRGDLSGHQGLFDCAKAERLLGWKHP